MNSQRKMLKPLLLIEQDSGKTYCAKQAMQSNHRKSRSPLKDVSIALKFRKIHS